MNKKTLEKLLKMGWKKEWLTHVANNFKSKRKGKYKIQIFDIEELDQDPETGVLVATTHFSDEKELSLIHYFFEGFAYVLYNAETKEGISSGILDYTIFGEMEEMEEKAWDMLEDAEVEELFGIKVMFPGVKHGDTLFVSVAERFTGKVSVVRQEEERIFVTIAGLFSAPKFSDIKEGVSVWIKRGEIAKLRIA